MLVHGKYENNAPKAKKCIRERSPKTQNQENDPPTIGNGRVYPEIN